MKFRHFILKIRDLKHTAEPHSSIGESFIQVREPSVGRTVPLLYDPDDYLKEFNELITILCWDIYLCSGITRSTGLRAEFTALCGDRTRSTLYTAESEEEARIITEGMYDRCFKSINDCLLLYIFPLLAFRN